jgi:MFS family permease
MTVNALVVIFLTTIMLSLTRKIASLLTIVIAAGLFAVGFGMIALIEVLPLFILSTVIWTTGEILQATNTNVYIANHTPISHRGRFNAILPIIMGAGFALGPMVMGWFIEENGVTAVWPLMFLLSLIAGTALLILYLVEKRRTAAKHCSAEHSGDS